MKLELVKGSRSRVLAALLFAIMVIFAGRLFYLQVIQYGYYAGLAKGEQQKRLSLPAKRGEIFALEHGTPVELVMNETVYTVFADPQIIKNDEKVIVAVQEIAGGNAVDDMKARLANKESRYQILATKLSRVQAKKLKEKDLSGVGFQEVSQRVYPEGGLAAQTLGFVNTDGTGTYGVESALNDRLKGEDGLLVAVTDISDVPLTIGNSNINIPAKDGDDIVLSIDRNVQAKAEQALADGLKRTGATNGSAIVIDPQTGHVMAMATLPSYKPGEYYNVPDAAAFNNVPTSSPYEPGSVIKTFTMATGIDKGVVSPDSTYVNTDYIKIEDRVVSNAEKGHTGTITLQSAMNWSLNTGFVTVAQRLGNGTEINQQARDTMYDYFHNRFHMGEETGIEVAGEQAGEIVPARSSEGNAVRYSNMAFGQGMNVTMVQTAAAFSALVNGGKYYQPTVIAGVIKDGQLIPQDIKAPAQIIKSTTSDQLRIMTRTARATLLNNGDKPGYTIGGKTGTAETIVNGAYTDKQTVGSYLGFGGDETARYVIMVQVSGKNLPMQGARHAMPIFTDISNWMLDYLKVQPKE
ncbi:MAG: putative Peptidoglycan glycosyltransferase [Candidatus Saccharibacteria bacterium]|nr:putative Peptidoglycan glycosyltransferase [Candidatus Saccharibacteria bacterium]